MTAETATRPVQRRVPTLDTLSDSQIEAIRSIPAHDSAGAQPRSIEASRPVSLFLDRARYDLEQEKVFRGLPVPLSLSVMLPQPGSAVAVNTYGTDVLLTRAKDGVVHAFLNACTHKGSQLIDGGETRTTTRLICPYHAWTFALDGRLIGVPRSETFTGLCKENRPLAQLACHEAGGIIWVGLDRNRSLYDFSSIDSQLVTDFEALNLPRMHLYGRKIFDLKANWKLVLEPFLEPYHVQRLHAKSVGPLFSDTPGVYHLLGHNIRQISGKTNFMPDVLDIKGENIHKSVTHAYQVFPNMVVVTSPYYISVMILAPRDVDRTIVDYMMLTREAPDNAKAQELFSRSYETILSVFGGEDFHAAQLCQQGLASGAILNVVYSGMEEMIPLYYGMLEKQLGLDTAATTV
jgi:nitrite reductase/ring-hydroxylating ferredoxin subunit